MLPTAPLQAGGPGLGPSVALVVLGLVILAVFARRALRSLLAMLATEPVGAGEVSPGMVELEGAVVPDGGTFAVDAGGQRTEAVVARCRRRSRGEGVAGFALPVLRRLAPNALYETSARPFYLEDDTGRTPEAPLRDEGLVVTRTPRTSEFVVSDTAGGYSPFRQGLISSSPVREPGEIGTG